MKVPILSERDIEARANEVLAKYHHLTGQPITLPVPIERIILHILDIPILWEPIPSPDGRVIVSKITQPTCHEPTRIVLNEDLLTSRFHDCPGLIETAEAHEAGHGIYHIDHSRRQQLQLDLGPSMGDAFVSEADSFTSHLAFAIQQRGPIGDDWWREWQAHTFMRFVLMPRTLLRPHVAAGKHRTWRGLYELRATCQVTISALIVHLERMGAIRVDAERRIHDLTNRSSGQLPLTSR